MQRAMQSQLDSNLRKLHGVYDFAHPGGVFEVHLRSGGRFFAPKFPENSVWTCSNACCADGQTCCQLQIEWGKYGQYDLTMDMAALPPCCSGSAKGNPENWRKVNHVTGMNVDVQSRVVCVSVADDNEKAFHATGDEAHGL